MAGLTRDEFVSKKVFGLDVVTIGQAANSNLVKALRGESPFGSDLPNPPAGARFSRMPAGRPPVPSAEIAVIEQWIDDACLVGDTPERPFTWRRTAAEDAGSRHDDVFFVNPELGWAVNSDGKILRTNDGGASWQVQFQTYGLYLRCVGFASETHGWVGTLDVDPSARHHRRGTDVSDAPRVGELPQQPKPPKPRGRRDPTKVDAELLQQMRDLTAFIRGKGRPMAELGELLDEALTEYLGGQRRELNGGEGFPNVGRLR